MHRIVEKLIFFHPITKEKFSLDSKIGKSHKHFHKKKHDARKISRMKKVIVFFLATY